MIPLEVSTATVHADRSKAWRFGRFYTSVLAFVASVFICLAILAGEFTGGEFLPIFVASVGVSAVYSFSFCFLWLFGCSRVTYQLTSDALEVLRGQRVVRRIDRAEIEGFTIEGVMDFRHCLTDVMPPPEWPSGVVTLKRNGSRIFLPQIMIWGESEMRDAASAIRIALYTTNRLVD